MNTCEACGFALHPVNEVVQAATIRQGGPHDKPVVIRGQRAVGVPRGVLGIGRRRFEASDRGKLEDVAARQLAVLGLRAAGPTEERDASLNARIPRVSEERR